MPLLCAVSWIWMHKLGWSNFWQQGEYWQKAWYHQCTIQDVNKICDTLVKTNFCETPVPSFLYRQTP